MRGSVGPQRQGAPRPTQGSPHGCLGKKEERPLTEPDAWLELNGSASGSDHGPARCALWWRQSLSGAADSHGPAIGRIGRLMASDATGAALLLKRACKALRSQGCARVLAPMEADTWHPYRVLLSTPDPALAFCGEPDLDPRWSAWLQAAGFTLQARYVSALCSDLERRRPACPAAAACRIEPVGERPDGPLLEPIQRLVMAGFRRQPLFRPVPLEPFRQLWRPWRSALDPDQSLLAFDGDDLVGMLLAHADRPGGRRLVVRTLVVHPGRRWAGLGRSLLESCHGRAAAAGCDGVIHALMHEPGASIALSRPYAQPFRHHGLMGRCLLRP